MSTYLFTDTRHKTALNSIPRFTPLVDLCSPEQTVNLVPRLRTKFWPALDFFITQYSVHSKSLLCCRHSLFLKHSYAERLDQNLMVLRSGRIFEVCLMDSDYTILRKD
jgi:hypothetical protein